MLINKKYLLISLPFACFIIGYLLSNLAIGNKTYTTPKLIGLSLYEAIKLTSPHQINIRILSEKESANIPAGTILSQKPSPGRIIKTHQPIFVTTTKALPDIVAPQLLQQPIKSIEKTCSDMHLKCKVYELEYPAPANSCIAQLPQSEDVIHDKKMILYCAKDKQNMYLMPDFTNQELEQVLNELTDYTDKISIFRGPQKLTAPYQRNAKIVAQKPLAGSLVSIKPPLNVQLEIN
jgi:beta-lactam-binding protein with PASTA domain